MNEAGFITLSRRFFAHWLWEEKREFSRAEAWLDLIRMATFRDETVLIQGRCLRLRAGELAASVRYLSTRWGWSKTKVDRFIATLEKSDMVGTRNETGITVISLSNYARYNSGISESGTANGTHAGRGMKSERQKAGTEAGTNSGHLTASDSTESEGGRDSNEDSNEDSDDATRGTVSGHARDKSKNVKNSNNILPPSSEGEGDFFQGLSPSKPAPKPRPKTSVADPRHAETVKLYVEAWETNFDQKYAFQPRDAKALQSLLKQTDKPPDELAAMARWCWHQVANDRYAPGPFRKASTLHGFCENFAAIISTSTTYEPP